MTRAEPSIARVKLARSLPRLLAVPFLIFVFAGAAIAGGLVVGRTRSASRSLPSGPCWARSGWR